MKAPLLSDITNSLAPISDTPALDASVLIAHIVKQPRAWVMARPELTLTNEQQQAMTDALARLDRGEPFPYVVGHWEFFGLELDITPDVLIPRPETELLVEKAFAWLQNNPTRRLIADIGTGSGAIAIAIAANVADARILATDISAPALDVAQKNAEKFSVSDRISFVQCDLLPQPFSHLPTGHGLVAQAFDLMCANLPYIPTQTLHHLSIFGREPTLALDGGLDGLDVIRRLLKVAPERLSPKAMMLVEIEATRGIQALNLACDIFSRGEIHLHRDLAGHDRLLEIML